MHQIRVDRDLRILDVRFSGEPTPVDVGWMAECVRHAILSLGEDAGSHTALFDCTAVRSVAPGTIDHIRASLPPGRARPLAARRTAFVVEGATERLQVERLASVLPGMQIFECRNAALAWLHAEGRQEP